MINNIINNSFKKKLFVKFVNIIMVNGKKEKAEKVLLSTIKLLKKKYKNPIKIITRALINSKLLLVLHVKKKRKITQTIPTPILEKKQLKYGMVNIINVTKKNKKIPMHLRLLQEFINISNNKGTIIDNKKQIYKSAEQHKLLLKHIRF